VSLFETSHFQGEGMVRQDGRMLTSDATNSKVYVSFGGLLLYLEGPYKKLTPLRIDYVYLLIKK
jgi:hypothetical protein